MTSFASKRQWERSLGVLTEIRQKAGWQKAKDDCTLSEFFQSAMFEM
jgi:hypothetical protein